MFQRSYRTSCSKIPPKLFTRSWRRTRKRLPCKYKLSNVSIVLIFIVQGVLFFQAFDLRSFLDVGDEEQDQIELEKIKDASKVVKSEIVKLLEQYDEAVREIGLIKKEVAKKKTTLTS